ncbi:Amino acid adenylation domain-containing protein OS=Streptomyces rutgersensis OX=53451 GN=F0345_28460 PE=4 SV=1 [Streptomyces diastaticus subsp. diastaticus]
MYAVDELKDVPALPAAFETAAAAAADRTALECGKRVLTYRELNAAANRLARRLRSSEGVTAGSRVAIHMSRSVELYVALLAVLKLGGVVVPLNPAHPVAVRRSAAEEAQPVLTLRDVPAGLGSVTAERDVHELVAASASLPDGNLAEAVDPESTAFILFTSGSTGRPKGVLIPHRAIARVADHNGHAVVLPDDCFLQTSPYSFAASTTEIWLSLLHGARLVVPPPQLPSLPELARLITEHGVTFLNLPCGLFNLLVDGHPEALDGVRSVIVSGGFPSPEHLSRALRAVGGAVHNAYGCTENSAPTAVRALTEEDVRRQVFPVGLLAARGGPARAAAGPRALRPRRGRRAVPQRRRPDARLPRATEVDRREVPRARRYPAAADRRHGPADPGGRGRARGAGPTRW